MPEQQIWEAHQGTMENSCIEHCAHTSESTNIKVQNVYHEK
jgi:hypothetical protein